MHIFDARMGQKKEQGTTKPLGQDKGNIIFSFCFFDIRMQEGEIRLLHSIFNLHSFDVRLEEQKKNKEFLELFKRIS